MGSNPYSIMVTPLLTISLRDTYWAPHLPDHYPNYPKTLATPGAIIDWSR